DRDLPQGVSFMTFLPARRLVRRLAQTSDPRWIAQPVARRRLTAVRTVQSQPALKLGDTRFQSGDLGRLRRDQRNQLFPRRLARRITIESKQDSAVQKNLPAPIPKTHYATLAVTARWHKREHQQSQETSAPWPV